MRYCIPIYLQTRKSYFQSLEKGNRNLPPAVNFFIEEREPREVIYLLAA